MGEARAGLALPLAACAAMNSPAISSALPPISPIMTIPLVCRRWGVGVGWGSGGGGLRGRKGRGVARDGGGCDGGTGGRAEGAGLGGVRRRDGWEEGHGSGARRGARGRVRTSGSE